LFSGCDPHAQKLGGRAIRCSPDALEGTGSCRCYPSQKHHKIESNVEGRKKGGNVFYTRKFVLKNKSYQLLFEFTVKENDDFFLYMN
jgi:hypothetical protein